MYMEIYGKTYRNIAEERFVTEKPGEAIWKRGPGG
jgi:hypothetical protein